jgi:S-DNA-T family DNA segregation ATPase FtsK/SpoIIIE
LKMDIFGLILIGLGLGLSATMLVPSTTEVGNFVGSTAVFGIRFVFGIAGYLVGPTILGSGIWICLGKQINYVRIAKALVAILLFLTAIHIFFAPPERQIGDLVSNDVLQRYGGFIGGQISYMLVGLIGRLGAKILMVLPVIGGVLVLIDKPLPELLAPLEAFIVRILKDTSSKAVTKAAALKSARAVSETSSSRAQNRIFGAHDDADEYDDVPAAMPVDTVKPVSKRKEFVRSPVVITEPVDDTPVSPLVVPQGGSKSLFDVEGDAPLEETLGDDGAGGTGSDSRVAEPVSKVVFQMPPTSLLAPAVPLANPQAGASEARRQRIIQCLEDFGIGAEIERISYGPTITRYEVALERGIKVSKIVSLADNLAMDLAAIDVRVEAPIPGRSAIGIEVPTDTPTPVMLRECLEAPEFKNAAGRLTFVLGKDVTGNVRVADLAKMPHLLVGGSTGSGKSVGLNVLITSLIYRNSPRELKFLMIDPKKVELSLYAGIPHLASPVVTNPKQAPSVFKQAIREMESRYDKFARLGTRNIEGYNAKVDELEKLPYWVLVVDELADLMMTSGPEIETGICRLAQLARATGIHLVIATQRPSVNVITGTIKANISSRIAFAVNSAVDSRTILDQVGADRLIGRGDMLFMPMDAAKPFRIQGAFLSEGETEALVKFLRHQGSPNYDVQPSSLAEATHDADSAETGHEDDLFESAVRLVVTGGSASTSMLQRRFKIGYTRAARLVDMMEQKGIVGALDGAKPREILITRDEMEAMFGSTDVSMEEE